VVKHGTLGRGEFARGAEIKEAPFESNHIRIIETQGGPCRVGDGVKGCGKRGCGILVAKGRELRGKRWAFIIVVVVVVASAAPSSAAPSSSAPSSAAGSSAVITIAVIACSGIMAVTLRGGQFIVRRVITVSMFPFVVPVWSPSGATVIAVALGVAFMSVSFTR
jgi:hypothetical protein